MSEKQGTIVQVMGPVVDVAFDGGALPELKEALEVELDGRREVMEVAQHVGGDTVRYAYPKEIKKQLTTSMKEIAKLKRNGQNDKDVVFRLVRIIAQIWQTHPFREGNTRSVIVFAVLLAKSLGFEVEHELFRTHSAYVRSALVWASQGIYAKYEYLERIFFDAILHDELTSDETDVPVDGKYEKIDDYLVRDYKERPHEYQDHEKSQK